MITEFSKIVCIPEINILEKGGEQHIHDVRGVYWLILLENGYNYSDIGRLCDRTHATILSSIKRIRQLLEIGDKEITLIYEQTKHIRRRYEKR